MSTPQKIRETAAHLRAISAEMDSECDVRLQLYADGTWKIRFGLSDYDQDGRGYWGASFVPGAGQAFNSVEVAKDLWEQALDAQADDASVFDEVES